MRAIYYHRVVPRRDPSDPYLAGALEVAELQAHAAELARHWRVLSLDELAAHLVGGEPLPDRAVHVSFDDGFRDNLVAAEVLDAHRLPWTLFPVVDAVLAGYRPWYVRLADALSVSSATARCAGEVYDLGSTRGKVAFKAQAKRAVMAAPAARHVEVLEEILSAAGLVEPEDTSAPFLCEAELRQLAAGGIEIGNHSATHPNLAACSPAELVREVVDSRARLEEALGRPVRYFSYPDGRSNPAAESFVRSTHRLAMSTWTAGRPLSPFGIRRYPVGPGVDDLKEVLAPGYPLRFRARRARWALRGRARRLGWRAGARR